MTLGEERDYWRREVLDHCGPDEYGALAGFDKELAEADSAQGLGNGVRHRGVSNDWDLAPTELGLHEPASLAERLKAQMRWRGMDLPGACGERNALCVCAIEFSRRKSDRLSRQAPAEQKETLDKTRPFFLLSFSRCGHGAVLLDRRVGRLPFLSRGRGGGGGAGAPARRAVRAAVLLLHALPEQGARLINHPIKLSTIFSLFPR